MKEISAQFQLTKGNFHLNAEFSLPTKGITAVVGPSGSGKTTLLRCIAGLEQTQGTLNIGDQCWLDSEGGIYTAPHLRSIGYVFQSAHLFPHLSVAQNIDYGRKRTSHNFAAFSKEELVKETGISHLLERNVTTLSGGERQRVALACAILANPSILLLDEPISALDGTTKHEILGLIEYIARQLSIPIIYVSHAMDEVSRLADRLVTMAQGQVMASGVTRSLLTDLELPLAQQYKAHSIFDATVIAHLDHRLTHLEFAAGNLFIPGHLSTVGQSLKLQIYAKDVSLALEHPGHTTILNLIPGYIKELQAMPERPGQCVVKLEVAGLPLLAHVTEQSAANLQLHAGLHVYAQVKSIAILR